ncbi:MAG: hypothetical protein ACFCD0_15275 [Gemmataceae bacterium]
MVALLLNAAQSKAADSRKAVETLSESESELQAEVDEKKRLARLENLLPHVENAQKLSRYEKHLSKQLFQYLHELERLQSRRADNCTPDPMGLDVTVLETDE